MRWLRFVRGEVEHHGEIAHAAELRQEFGMAGIVMPGLPECSFMQGGGDDSCHAAIEREAGGRNERIVGGLAAARIDGCRRGFERVVSATRQAGNGIRR